jgi:glycine/D-amino acid oxidase-like deaminating enzyme
MEAFFLFVMLIAQRTFDLMKDVIIVGSGITGCTLAWTWLLKGKTVAIISDKAPASSSVAAGVYNPTVLKRFTPIWKAQEQLDVMLPFYKAVESHLGRSFLQHVPVLRRLYDAGEAATWTRKAQRDDLRDFMDPEVFTETIDGIDAPHGYGVVQPTGACDTEAFMTATIEHLEGLNSFNQQSFEHQQLQLHNDFVTYKHLQARHIIFAEGFAMRHNTYYNHLPLEGNKGELLIVRIPGLELNYIIKSSVFLTHYKEDLFWVGATYNRDDLTAAPTSDALAFLTSRLEKFLKVPYEIVEHKVGIRPTTQDRRPFLGSVDSLKRHFICNGMGSRAVLLAPWAAIQLYNHIYNAAVLDSDVDCNRVTTS